MAWFYSLEQLHNGNWLLSQGCNRRSKTQSPSLCAGDLRIRPILAAEQSSLDCDEIQWHMSI